MKTKRLLVVSLFVLMGFALSSCTFSFNVDGKTVIEGQADKSAIQQLICINCEETETSVVTEVPMVEETETPVVTEVPMIEETETPAAYQLGNIACGYRNDMFQLLEPDRGLSVVSGTITGPAIFQPDSKNIWVIEPEVDFVVKAGKVWLYDGNIDCLNSQLEFFPGKQIHRVKN